jgi:hypothetical protein
VHEEGVSEIMREEEMREERGREMERCRNKSECVERGRSRCKEGRRDSAPLPPHVPTQLPTQGMQGSESPRIPSFGDVLCGLPPPGGNRVLSEKFPPRLDHPVHPGPPKSASTNHTAAFWQVSLRRLLVNTCPRLPPDSTTLQASSD